MVGNTGHEVVVCLVALSCRTLVRTVLYVKLLRSFIAIPFIETFLPTQNYFIAPGNAHDTLNGFGGAVLNEAAGRD